MIQSPIIIGLSGKKGAGKNTLASSIALYYIKKINPAPVGDGSYMLCAFADHLKLFCIQILGLDYNQCYGSDEEKNTPTIYKWEDTPYGQPRRQDFSVEYCKTGFMTGREVMQIFGTECVRAWFGNVWAKATIRQIHTENPKVAIITDVRFPNEIDEILAQPNSAIIRLTRSIAKISGEDDSHSSEKLLDNYDWTRKNCYVLHNEHMSLDEQRKEIISIVNVIFNKN